GKPHPEQDRIGERGCPLQCSRVVSLKAAGNGRRRGMIIAVFRLTGKRNRIRLMIRSGTFPLKTR
ncbi:MAG: hypothetical protein PHP66_07035, partial [Syntrophales bacterium]|nr:hypothetical protein [Syntrophales bacterium]